MGDDVRMRWRTVSRLGCQLPEVLSGRTYGTPVLCVRGSFMARLSDDRRSVLVKAGDDQRAALCASTPGTFSAGGPAWNGSTVAVRLARVERDQLWELLVGAWRQSAPPSLLASVDPSALRRR